MNFSSGTDKIDLTGIRTQLGQQPLSLVERFSGVSGEMTINYYAGSNTSFVTISRNPGEPPFELKVSGEVRYRDIKA
ncbi:M10 family metallopeptidase C-terminal domain-containing protein [Pseudomonas sp. ERGC3:05]|nr:M10 family metallopeptidase C-terminal domain-containing protein [Pseudomonas sp. ERGC3:01]QZC93340.1 M10 family metallopeptidase C-terminal domain-containing protein [Pseudomonas sp. ERGC3:05]